MKSHNGSSGDSLPSEAAGESGKTQSGLWGGVQSRLGRQLLIRIVATSSLITLVLTAEQLHREYREDIGAIEKRLQEIELTQTAAISNQLWELNEEILGQTLDGLAKLPEIDFLWVSSADGFVQTAGPRTAQHTLERQYPLLYETPARTVSIGTLHVVATLAPAHARLFERLGTTLAGNAAKTFIVSGVVLALIHLLVIRRLGALGAFCKAWRIEDDARPPPPVTTRTRPDEIDDVSSAVRGMLAGIERSYSQLRASEQRYRQLIETAKEGVWLLDENDTTRFVNPRLARMLGHPRDELVGRPLLDFVDQAEQDRVLSYLQRTRSGQVEQFELALRCAGDALRWALISASPIVSDAGDRHGTLAMVTDIDQRKRAEARVNELAYFDPLTQLPNRASLHDRLGEALARALRRGEPGALLFLDLDNFKTVNDSRGHHTGDAVLTTVAMRLRDSLRDNDFISRFGGDEFIIVLSELHHDRESAATTCSRVAEKLIAAVGLPMTVEGHELRLSASVGITVFEGRESPEAILQNADTALYRAKSAGRGALTFYREEMGEAARRRLSLEKGLRDAVANDSIDLVYQPIVDSGDGRVIGVEALARWTHPEYGPIPPDVFIPIAEETGVISAISQQCLARSCADLAPLLHDPDAGLDHGLSVNLSPLEIVDPALAGRVQEAMDASGIPAERLQFEITEGTVIQQTDAAVANMRAIRALGPSFAVDDFGTGYSSLRYLKSLPLSTLKIDRSFVQDLGVSADAAAIVDTILAVAEHFGLEVIAEGIETRAQLAALRARGASTCQGYYFARPMPIEALRHFIQTGTAPDGYA